MQSSWAISETVEKADTAQLYVRGADVFGKQAPCRAIERQNQRQTRGHSDVATELKAKVNAVNTILVVNAGSSSLKFSGLRGRKIGKSQLSGQRPDRCVESSPIARRKWRRKPLVDKAYEPREMSPLAIA